MNWCICAGLDDLWSRSHVLCVFGGKSNKVEDVLAFFQGHLHVEYTVIQLFTQNINELDNAHPLWGNPCGLLCQPTHYITQKHPHLEECFTKYLAFLCPRKLKDLSSKGLSKEEGP